MLIDTVSEVITHLNAFAKGNPLFKGPVKAIIACINTGETTGPMNMKIEKDIYSICKEEVFSSFDMRGKRYYFRVIYSLSSFKIQGYMDTDKGYEDILNIAG